MSTAICVQIRAMMIIRYEDLDTVYEHAPNTQDRLQASENMCELRKALDMSHDQILRAATLKHYA
jgi:hypothetical protein